jgi:chemosensory pili system protein ChpA (sensor histidine kinase/response regulator)
MDGFELMSRLRSDPRTQRIPIVIVTSRIAEKHQKRAADLGGDVFFGKPYAEEKLLADVAELLDRRAGEAAA